MQEQKMQESLTKREQEIFDALIEGLSPKEISSRLNISFHTVKYHQKKLYEKLDVNSIKELLYKYKPGNTSNIVVPDGTNHVPAKARKLPPLKVLLPAAAVLAVVLAIGLFLLFRQPGNTAPIELPLAEQPFPANFILPLQETDSGGKFNFEPDVFEYNNVSYPSPFKLGEGNRLTQGDIYQVTCSFTPNVDLSFVYISFFDSGTQDEYGNWTELSSLTEFRDGYKANTRHTFSTKILVTKTAGSVFPLENIFYFHANSPSGNTPELTFHEFEVRKISSMQSGVTATVQDLAAPLVITFEDTNAENPNWSYSFSYTDFLYQREMRPSPFKLGSGNRITEDDIYQISCTYTSNVDLESLNIRFIDDSGSWTSLSPILQLQRYTKAGEETSATINLMATRTARGASPTANTIYMFTMKTSEEPPVLTFTHFEIVKIN